MTGKHFDVVVIGGGLVGCATAYYLSKQGAQVALVEKGQLNRKASGQNAGSLHFQLEQRFVMHWKQLEKEMAELIPFSLISEELWAGLENELEADMEVIQHGGIMVAETEEEMKMLKQKYDMENKWGLGTELMTSEDVKKIAPYLSDKVKGASYCATEGHANPRLVTLQFAKKAQDFNTQIFTESNVTDLKQEKNGWIVELNREDYLKATNVVITTGAWSKDLVEMAGLHIPMYPIPLTMNITESVEPVIHHLIQHVGKRLTLKQVRDGNILIGGGWSSQFVKKDGKLDLTSSPKILTESVKGNVQIAADLVPAIKDFRLIRTWPGVTGVSIDQLPILGEFPERKGLYIGGGGSGFTFGPLYGKVLSELILNGKTDYSIEAFSPKKFSHLNMFMP